MVKAVPVLVVEEDPRKETRNSKLDLSSICYLLLFIQTLYCYDTESKHTQFKVDLMFAIAFLVIFRIDIICEGGVDG